MRPIEPARKLQAVTPEEAVALLERSRELRFAFPSSFGDPGLEGDAPDREKLAEAVSVLDDQQADELAANTWRLWMIAPRDVEGGRRFLEGKKSSGALYGAGLLALRDGDVVESRRLSEQALEVADGPEETALAHLGLSRVAFEEGNADEALRHALDARQAAAPLGEPPWPTPLHLQAQALRLQGDLDQAAELFEESLVLNRRIGDEGMVLVEVYNLGLVNVRREDREAAERYLTQVEDDPLAAAALAFVRGDEDAARAHLDQVDDGELPTDDRAEAEWLRSRL
jgi:tetratricopeptide (TPR) repeat protein